MSRNSDATARGRRSCAAIVAVVSLIVGVPALARGADCADEATALRAHLEREAWRARRWNAAWAIAFGGAAVVQGALAIAEWNPLGTFDRDYEETLYVGAAKATIGAAARLVMPLRVRVPATSGDPCVDLPALRAALADAGRRERRTFWLTHLGGLALNLTGAALLASRRSFAVGATSFAIALPVGPTSAYTQPRESWHRWRAARASWSIGVTASPGGAMLWLVR